MEYESIIYDKKDGVARITMNRPKVMNALTPALVEEVKSAMLDAGNDDDVMVVVLTGAGRAFSAGVDLKALGRRKLVGGRVGPILDDPGRELIEIMQSMPKIVIAMVNGFCFTGAMEIMLACDLVIASEDAKFGDTHARWGVRPSWGMSQRLPHTVGISKARWMSFTADTIDGKEAEKIGLVNMAVPADKLEETTEALVKKLMTNSRSTLAAYKYLYNYGQRLTFEDGLKLEFNSEFDIRDTEERIAQFRK